MEWTGPFSILATINRHVSHGRSRTIRRGRSREEDRRDFVAQTVRKLLGDLHDLAVVAVRRSEKPVSIEDMKQHLKKNGVDRQACHS